MPPSKHEIPGDRLLASLELDAVRPALPMNISPSRSAVLNLSTEAGARAAAISLSQNSQKVKVFIMSLSLLQGDKASVAVVKKKNLGRTV